MSDDTSGDGIASLNRLFLRYCTTQPNEGGRLSMAKTKFSEAVYWLRLNADVHRERMVTDERQKQRLEVGDG
jgi:5-keto 4-deoxyuronate isomerase